MKTRSEAIAACMDLPGVYEDYPFSDPAWTCMRHGDNQKIFAFIFERDGWVWINVKAEPLKADFWRDAFEAVLPAYHLNKRHWIGIRLDGSMNEEDIRMLIADSYHLTRTKTKRSKA